MAETLIETYERRASEGSLTSDAAQRAVLLPLQMLRIALEESRPRGLAGLFARPSPMPKGVYLWGGVGRGKSMLMDLFFGETQIREKRRVHFHAFMQEIQTALHVARKSGAEDAIRPVAEAVAADLRLLCFDEMQITDIADAMIVGRLFQILLEKGVSVVTTSNRRPDQLYENGLNRALFLPFIRLLEDRLTILSLDSDRDYRLHLLEGAQVYFSPVDRAASAAIDTIWNDLTGSAQAHPLRLHVKGREVVLPKVHAGVARASFWDLCGNPLGPADYLAVAAAVRVLILEGVPRLSSENYNEAKRFVTLIDTLYEARVRFICSAADEPERLYIEGEGSFEFSRTASRLREMQSARWAAES